MGCRRGGVDASYLRAPRSNAHPRRRDGSHGHSPLTLPTGYGWAIITHLVTRQGPLLLAVIVDVHSRRVVGWAMDNHQRLELAERALQMALQHRRPTTGLILHHDRGSQYTGARYRAKAEEAKIQLSMSRPSMPYDNAVAESFFATLKLELLEGPAYATRDDARQAVFEYLEIFYNRVPHAFGDRLSIATAS